jgi:integrase
MGTITKEKSKYRIRWKRVDGTRGSLYFGSHSAAKRALARMEVVADEIRVGIRPPPSPIYTFDELCDYWIEHRASRKKSGKDDASIIRRHLKPTFGHMNLEQITLEQVDRFRKRICPDERDSRDPGRGKPPAGRVTVKTLHNILTLLISILNLAVDLRWLVKKPNIKKPKLLRPDFTYIRTVDDIQSFLLAARDEAVGTFELYASAIYTGMRCGELMALHWADVDLGKRLITVQRSYLTTTKTDEIRYVPILDVLLPIIRAWKLSCPSRFLVFPNKNGNMHTPSPRISQEILQQVRMRAEISYRFTFHDLRHSFASHWMMNGGNIYRLQKILGHKSIIMTERYSHLSPTAFTADYGILGEPLPIVENQDGAEIVALQTPK